MKVLSVAFSVLLAQSVAANNSTDDYYDDMFNATYAPTPSSSGSNDGVTITMDTPAPTPSLDDYTSYAPTLIEADDYITSTPTLADDEESYAPTVGEDDGSPFVQDDMIDTNETSTPAPSAVQEEDDYVEGDDATPAPYAEESSTPAPTSVSGETPAPTAFESDDGTYAPSTSQDDYSKVTVEEIDDAYSMDYRSTISAVEIMSNSASVRGAASVVLGVGCIAYYLL